MIKLAICCTVIPYLFSVLLLLYSSVPKLEINLVFCTTQPPT